MKSESNKQSGSANKEEVRKMRQSLSGPPQLTLDPERRGDFFNRLLEKYTTKSTKVGSPNSGSSFGPRSVRFPTVPSSKAPSKIKDKFLKKKKSCSEKCIVKSTVADDYGELDPMETWKNSVRNHVFDPTVYKSHTRIRTRFPYPMPTIEEVPEPVNSSEASDSEETKSGDTMSFESVNHSFTLLPCGDQKHGSNWNSIEVKYEEKVVQGKNPLPEELQPRHLTKTASGTLIWVGNDIIHDLLQRKVNRKHAVNGVTEKESKLMKEIREFDDLKSSGEGEERPPSKRSGKARRPKIKKNSSAQELEENLKTSKPISQDAKSMKPSSSSLPHLQLLQTQEEVKSVKKLNEKVKKPKKLTKKQAFTVVTSKPSI